MAWQKEFRQLLTLAGYAPHRAVLPMRGLVVVVEGKAPRKRDIGKYKETKPDIDNLQKSILDSLWGKHGLYANLADDNAVGHIEVIKVHGLDHRMSFFHNTEHSELRDHLLQEIAELERLQTRSPVKPSRSSASTGGHGIIRAPIRSTG